MKEANDEPALRSCAIDFLKQFVPELEDEVGIWLSCEPERQYKATDENRKKKVIDILLTVNDKYKIIIEDKVYTKEHDDQLKKYREIVESSFNGYQTKGVYFKTGFQSDKTPIEKANYTYFDLKKILNIIKKYVDETKNDIFRNYYFYLQQRHESIEKYKYLPVCEWREPQINGFYDFIKQEFRDVEINYGYVANRSGGFYALWIKNHKNQKYHMYENVEYALYLQCEFADDDKKKICYKAMCQSDNKIKQKERDYFTCHDLIERYGFSIPTNKRSGKSVTLAIYKVDSFNISYIEMKDILRKAIDDFQKFIDDFKINT